LKKSTVINVHSKSRHLLEVSEKLLSYNSITWAKSELGTSRMRCSTNHLGNLLVVFYALSKFEYIISDFDVRRGKGASADF